MPNLIDKPQLQATAQVAKSYILEQDTNNVNTIINALQQSGGTTGGLLDPNLRLENDKWTWDGNGRCTMNGTVIQKGEQESLRMGELYLLDSDGTYAQAWYRNDVD